ncbi:MAG: hypothetical protein Q9185_001751 [Variospora sp. 1 TL-2023]
MTTALPSFLADPSLPTKNHPPPPPNQPIPPPPNSDLEAAAAAANAVANAPQTPNDNTARTSTGTSRHSNSSSAAAPSIPWGPSHPCYPHPNAHLPLASPLAASTRIIRVPRDWMPLGDLAPQYSMTYPEILEQWVSEQDFRVLVGRVNEGLEEAFTKGGWRDLVLGVATGWLWEDFGGASVKRGCRVVEAQIEEWNRGREGEGVRCWGLRRTGYMSLDIQIPDPHIRVVGAEEEEEEQEEEQEEQETNGRIEQQEAEAETATAPNT